MFKLRSIEEKSTSIQIFKYFRISLLYKESCKWSCLAHIPFLVNELYEWKVIFASYFRIIFTKCWCQMNNTSTICQSYIIITGNKECFLFLFCCTVICTLVKRFIFFVFQIFSFVSFQNFVCRFVFFCKFPKNGVKQSACHIISISVCTFYFCVIFFRVYAECDIRRKSPRCGCPCKDVCIFVFHFETNDSRTFFDVLISLCNFLC